MPNADFKDESSGSIDKVGGERMSNSSPFRPFTNPDGTGDEADFNNPGEGSKLPQESEPKLPRIGRQS